MMSSYDVIRPDELNQMKTYENCEQVSAFTIT